VSVFFHMNVVDCDIHNLKFDDLVQVIQAHNSKAQLPASPSMWKGHALSQETLESAVTHMLLSHYSNQVLHVLLPVGMVALVLTQCKEEAITRDTLLARYGFLENLLSNEFIFEDDATESELNKALRNLHKLNAIS